MTSLLILPVALPLLMSLLALIWPARGNQIGVVTGLLIVLIGSAIVALVAGNGAQSQVLGGWQAGLGIALYADGLTALMLLMSALIGLAASTFACRYFAGKPTLAQFWPLWLLLQAAISALLLSADLFNLYVALELLGLSAVALTALGSGRAALKAAVDYLLLGLVGSLVFLAAVVLIYARYGTLDMLLLGAMLQAEPITWVALALFTTSLMLKCALFPLHFWLPAVHANAPAPVSAALSALVVKVVFYLLLRLWVDLFAPVITPPLASVLGVLGAAAILWGSFCAIRAERLKLLAAYSTIAQLGYLFLFFSLLVVMPEGAQRQLLYGALLLFALTHGFAKSALFLAAGEVQQRLGHDRIVELGGFSQALPTTLFATALAGIALIGLPPSGSFLAKWQLMAQALNQGHWYVVLVVALGSLLACIYLFRLLGCAFSPSLDKAPPAVERREQLSPLMMALIATVVLGLGSHPLWQLLADAGGGGV